MKRIQKLFVCVTLITCIMTLLNGCKKNDTISSSDVKENGINFNKNLTYGTMTDQDGNIYKTIKIGTQTWMAENLRTTKNRNGSPLKNISENAIWLNNLEGAYCWYNNDEATYKATMGALYSWVSIVGGNIAPLGWHISSNEEWETMYSYLQNTNSALPGYQMKEQGTIHWKSQGFDSGETNVSGFTALPAGVRDGNDGSFYHLGTNAYFWTSSKHDDEIYLYAIYWTLYYDNARLERVYHGNIFDGFSVRCVKD